LRENVLERFRCLGRVFLHSFLQRQPIPSYIASPLLLAGLFGVDPIRPANGNSGGSSSSISSSSSSSSSSVFLGSEGDLRHEVERSSGEGMLQWLFDGLAKKKFSGGKKRARDDEDDENDEDDGREDEDELNDNDDFDEDDGVTLASLSFGAFDDDEPVTAANREAKLRRALGEMLVDSRREVLGALAEGFSLCGEMAEVRRLLLARFRRGELRELFSGHENITPAAFLKIVQPIWPDDDEEEGEDEDEDEGDDRSEDEDEKSARRRINFEHITANVQLFWRVVESKAFAPHLRELLRFITGSPAIVDRDLRIKLQFVKEQRTSAVPKAHTCFQTLDLSCAPYESEKHLAALLETCARNSTAFGMR
jgi:hypothetical protein